VDSDPYRPGSGVLASIFFDAALGTTTSYWTSLPQLAFMTATNANQTQIACPHVCFRKQVVLFTRTSIGLNRLELTPLHNQT
jgi:hypothetical protein